jgi:hypothetical protein
MILETYTTTKPGDVEPLLPEFVTVEREITGDLAFSMYNLSKMQAATLQNGNRHAPVKTVSVS